MDDPRKKKGSVVAANVESVEKVEEVITKPPPATKAPTIKKSAAALQAGSKGPLKKIEKKSTTATSSSSSDDKAKTASSSSSSDDEKQKGGVVEKVVKAAVSMALKAPLNGVKKPAVAAKTGAPPPKVKPNLAPIPPKAAATANAAQKTAKPVPTKGPAKQPAEVQVPTSPIYFQGNLQKASLFQHLYNK